MPAYVRSSSIRDRALISAGCVNVFSSSVSTSAARSCRERTHFHQAKTPAPMAPISTKFARMSVHVLISAGVMVGGQPGCFGLQELRFDPGQRGYSPVDRPPDRVASMVQIHGPVRQS